MRAMRAEGFGGYSDLKLADIPKPQVSEGRVLVKIAAAGVTPLEHHDSVRRISTSECAFGPRVRRGGRR